MSPSSRLTSFRPHRWVAALAALAVGCAAPMRVLDQQASLVTASGTFELRFAEVDREAQRSVQRAMEAAAPRLAVWGGLRSPVTVRVLPNHEALEQAVGRGGVPWLRAWALRDEVLVQSPRTWGLPLLGASQRELERLMLHELTHCVLFQRATQHGEVAEKRIPFWFREGMASYTAGEGFRWAGLEDLAHFYERASDEDPLSPTLDLYRREWELVYGAAHHAFSFLVRRYGLEQVHALMDSMREGRTFAEAFEAVFGLPKEAFEREFRRYVTLRGFKGGRLHPSVAPPPGSLPAAPPVTAGPPAR